MQKCFNAFSAAKHKLVLQNTLNAQVAAKLQNCAKMLSKHGCCKAPKAGQVHLLQSRVLGAAKHPLVAQGNRQGVSPGSPWPVFFLVKTDPNVSPSQVPWQWELKNTGEVSSSMSEMLGALLIGSQCPSAHLGGGGLQWTLPALSPWVAKSWLSRIRWNDTS